MSDLPPRAHHAHAERHGCGCQGNCPRRQGAPVPDQGRAAQQGPDEGETPAGA